VNPGCIVRCRNRDWVLLPSDEPDLHLLRPLTGATDEVMAISKSLSNLLRYTYPEEGLTEATFPPPKTDDISNAVGTQLLWQAARLTLREGAAPLRSPGRISITPRTYQFVPLLMALRLETIRMLIADDVGVGKTVEALLIAREMLDRGEIKRLCVLCPPYLCEQWQKELSEKFNLEAVLIRSGTVNQLERRIPSGKGNVFDYYPVQVVSIDFVKGDRKRDNFIQHCAEFVIVDEAHGAASASSAKTSQQQRHALLQELAASPARHLVLLTATPHSGVPEAFQSLLALLRPEFGSYDVGALTQPQREELALHFVQRTRKDIETQWESESCFPKREATDEAHTLSPEYRRLFEKTYEFCSELVRGSEGLDKRRQRVRYWAALALLRCVMSSPAAAVAALDRKQRDLGEFDDDVDFSPNVFESADEQTDDTQPTPPIEAAERGMEASERRRLRELSTLAASIAFKPADTKLNGCATLVARLLRDGFQPIVWCRYIATAQYVAQGLTELLKREFPSARVVAITGALADEERRVKVLELGATKPRVLVATDCLSEGINLQNLFNAALHYDLPWNPNRLEQREGRVDRYGQSLSKVVRTIRFFSPQNPVDGVVIRVLLDKAREIHHALGTHVPVPEESDTVTQAVLQALFLSGRTTEEALPQLELGLELPEVNALHRSWEASARSNSTRFAQRALKPAEVRSEVEQTDKVLGDPTAVQMFVLNAAERLGLGIVQDRREPRAYAVSVSAESRLTLPEAVQAALPQSRSGQWRITFSSPAPEGAEYLGRNHRFVASLAQYLMEEALTKGSAARASRCAAMRTTSVTKLTTLYLLRVRYMIELPGRAPLLAEEVQLLGRLGLGAGAEWLDGDQPLALLEQARPEVNLPLEERRELVGRALQEYGTLQSQIHPRIDERGKELLESHKRIRKAVLMHTRGLTVTPHFPPDLLGMLVLQPHIQG